MGNLFVGCLGALVTLGVLAYYRLCTVVAWVIQGGGKDTLLKQVRQTARETADQTGHIWHERAKETRSPTTGGGRMHQQSMSSMVIVVLVGAVMMPLQVRTEAAGRSPRATALSSGGILQGAIMGVNIKQHRLQLRELDGRIVTFPIDPAVQIIREGRRGSLHDLAVGQTVNVQHTHRQGQSIATAIEVLPGSAPAPAAQGPNSDPGIRPSDWISGAGTAGTKPDAATR